MANHIKYMKSMVEQPVEVAKKEVTASGNRHSVKKRSSIGLKTALELEGRVSQVLEETVKNPATAQMIVVDKIYAITPEGGDYCQLGWVHRGAISRCMVCNQKFGLMGKKYNCTACGIVVCVKCSPQSAMIAELNTNERFRVCRRCFTGAKKLYALPHLRKDSNENMISAGVSEEKGNGPVNNECQVTLDFIISTLEEEAVNPDMAVAREVLQKVTRLNPEQLEKFERFLSRDNSAASTIHEFNVSSDDDLLASSRSGRAAAALRFITALKQVPENNRSLHAIDSQLAMSESIDRNELKRPLSTAALISHDELELIQSYMDRLEEHPEGGEEKKKKGKKGKKGGKKKKSYDDIGEDEGKGIVIDSVDATAAKDTEKKARMRKALKKIATANAATITMAGAAAKAKLPVVNTIANNNPEFDDISVLSSDSKFSGMVPQPSQSLNSHSQVMSPREAAISILSRDDTEEQLKLKGPAYEFEIEMEGEEETDEDEDEEDNDENGNEEEDDEDDEEGEGDEEEEEKDQDEVPTVQVDPGTDDVKTPHPPFCSLESCVIS